jgi:KAP family P-loop domain
VILVPRAPARMPPFAVGETSSVSSLLSGSTHRLRIAAFSSLVTKVHLKPDWDTPCPVPGVAPSSSAGHFVGRQQEIERLANELVRSPQRSILFSGHRGVGKTTLVYESVRHAQRILQDVSSSSEGDALPSGLVPVLLNANQLPTDPTRNRDVLVALIRRLYRATLDGPLGNIEDEIARLYKRAVASQFKQSESQGRALERIAEERRERVVTARLPELDARTIGSFAVAGLGALGLALADPLANSSLDNVLAILLAGPAPLLVSAGWKRERVDQSKGSVKDEAAELYEFDASPGNLEFDLERIHRELSIEGWRVVYIVDEVDKLNVDEALALFSAFKNLFTLSSAIFVFISDEKLFDHLQLLEESEFRPMSYTFFHSRYFIGRPRADDLGHYFDEVIEESDEKRSDPLYGATKESLIFGGQGDFFDFVQVLRDRIDAFDGIRPEFTLRPLTEAELRGGHLASAIRLVFEEKYQSPVPSEWRNNERCHVALYKAAFPLMSQTPGSALADPTEDELPAGAVRDLYRLLERAGMLVPTATTPTQIGGRELETKTYTFVGTASGGIPTSLDFLTEPELAVVAAYEAFDSLGGEVWETYRGVKGRDVPEWDPTAVELKERLRSWTLDLDAPRTAHDEDIRALREEEPPPAHDRSALDAWRADLESLLNTTLAGLPGVVANMFATVHGEDVSVESLPLTEDVSPLLSNLKARVSYPNTFVVSDKEGRRHVLFIPREALDVVQSSIAEASVDPLDRPLVVAVSSLEERGSVDVEREHMGVESPNTAILTFHSRPPRSDDAASNASALQRASAWLRGERESGAGKPKGTEDLASR